MSDGPKGGINIGGSVGRDVSLKAGRDLVIGNKETTTTITTTITNGFKQEEDKQQFLRDIEDLRSALRELQTKIQEAAGVSQDDKDQIVAEVMQQVNALKTAKEEAGSVPVAQEGPPDKSKRIANYLDTTDTLLDKVSKLGAKAVEIGTAVAPYVNTAAKLLFSARALFGLS